MTVAFVSLSFLVASLALSLAHNCSSTCSPTATIWYVQESSSVPQNDDSEFCCFENIDLALRRLLNQSVEHVSIILGRGNHTVREHHDIYSCSNVILTSMGGNGNDTVIRIVDRISFRACFNLSLVGLTFDITNSSDTTNFGILTFFGCRGVKLENSSFEFSVMKKSVSLVTNFDVSVLQCKFIFTVPSTFENFKRALKTNPTISAWGLMLEIRNSSHGNQTNNPNIFKNIKFEPKNRIDNFYGYDSIAKNEEDDVHQKRYLLSINFTRAENTVVNVTDVTISNLVFGFAGPAAIHVRSQATNSVINFDRVLIEGNKCFRGCGLLIQFDTLLPSQNTFVNIRESNFSSNTAVFEGGAVIIVTGVGEMNIENLVSFRNTVFERNTAFQYFGAGSAVMIFSIAGFGPGNDVNVYPLPTKVIFENCQFSQNHALYGTIFSKQSNIIINGTNTTFEENSGGAVACVGSNITLSGNATFESNYGCLYGCALDLRQYSHANFIDIDDLAFENNSATVRGGAIYADSTTSSEAFVDFVNSLAGLRTNGTCFITTSKNLTFDFAKAKSTYDYSAQVHFSNNNVYGSVTGGGLYASTLYLCPDKFIPRLQEEENSVGTSVSSITFVEATCECYKNVNDTRFHFDVGECRRDVVTERVECLKNKTCVGNSDINGAKLYRGLMESLDCFVENSKTSPLSRGNVLYQHRLFENDDLWVPFGSCIYGSSLAIGNTSIFSGRTNCTYPVQQPSEITLYPAPGEIFELYFNPRDEFFNNDSVQVSMQVMNSNLNDSTAPKALLRQADIEYGWQTKYFFDASKPVNDLSLVGVVGEKGAIVVSWSSPVFRGATCLLVIRFELSPCHIGYVSPNTNQTTADSYIRRSRGNTYLVEDSSAASPLACQCANLPHVHCGNDGRSLEIADSVWVGLLDNEQSPPKFSLITSLKNVTERKFGAHYCTKDCYDSSSTQTYSYNFSEPSVHCTPSHTGILCGACTPGTSLTVVRQECEKCDDWRKGLIATIFISSFTAVFFVTLSMVFKIVGSAAFGSWLFYIQVVSLFVRPEFYRFFGFHLAIFPTGMCVWENMTSLQGLAFTALLQLIFLFVIGFVYLLTCFRNCSKYIPTSKVLDAFLVVLIYVYIPITEFACSTISCTVYIGGEVRLLADPTVQCFHPDHTPYAIIGIIILILFVIPVPVIFLVYLEHPRLEKTMFSRRLRKACARRYRDGKEWWIGISFIRRFVLVLFSSVAAMATISKLLSMALICIAMILLQIFMRPYKKNYANLYETGILVNLFVFAGLNLNDPTSMESAASIVLIVLMGIVFWWPCVFVGLYAINRWRHRIYSCMSWLKGKCGHSSSEIYIASPSKKKKSSARQDAESEALLRDPLLAYDSDNSE